jgi:hypothetical protein
MNYKMESSLNCSLDNDLLYAELYDKILKLENYSTNILDLIQKQTNIIDFMITTSNTNDRIQTRINNDIIIIFIIILIILVCLFSIIKSKK